MLIFISPVFGISDKRIGGNTLAIPRVILALAGSNHDLELLQAEFDEEGNRGALRLPWPSGAA
jgi:hypothetical protein